MSTSGETADLLVRESIQITESAVKLAALGAKNLAALLLAIANDNQKVAGKTSLKKLLQSGDEISLFSIRMEDLDAFMQTGKQYGILYCPIVNKAEQTGMIEIMARSRDARQINRVLEKMGYLPERESPKKQNMHTLSENSLQTQKTGKRDITTEKTVLEENGERQSVKKKLEEIKRKTESKEMQGTQNEINKMRKEFVR